MLSMTANGSPNMLVIIVTSDGYATILKTLRCLRPQTVCDQLEIVVVVPLARELADAVQLKQFNHGLVEVGPMNSTAAARVAGARLTAAPIIAITEDPFIPTRDEQNAHYGPSAAVGPKPKLRSGLSAKWKSIATASGNGTNKWRCHNR